MNEKEFLELHRQILDTLANLEADMHRLYPYIQDQDAQSMAMGIVSNSIGALEIILRFIVRKIQEQHRQAISDSIPEQDLTKTYIPPSTPREIKMPKKQ